MTAFFSVLEYLDKNKIVFYLTTYFLLLIIFIISLFPLKTVISNIVYKVNESGYATILFDKVNASLFSDIKFKNLSIKTDNLSSPVIIDSISLNPSVINLFIGKLKGDYQIEIGGIKLNGETTISKKLFYIKGRLKNFSLEKKPYFKKRFQLNLKGEIRGNIEITVKNNNIKKAKGFINIEGKKIKLGKSEVYSIFQLPDINFNTLTVMLKIDKGNIKFDTFRLGENRPYLTLSGNITLKQPLSRSWSKLMLKLKLDDEFKDKIGQLLPSVGFSTGPSNEYVKHLSGTFLNILR